MSNTEQSKASKPSKPGPEPETLVIAGDWKDAVKQALKKGRPPAPKKTSKKKRKRAK